MKRIVYAVLATVSGLVLLFSYRTSLEAVMPADTSSSTTGSTSGAATSSTSITDGESTSGSGSSSSGASGSMTSTPSGYADGTYTGSAVDTRYGPVQVQITVAAGAITAVDVLEYPAGNRRDLAINQHAVPILVDETLSAQSSNVDMVSGATFTSVGYSQSLQSALDQARS